MLDKIKERFDYFSELDKKTGTKHHVLYIEPDYDALIWEEDTEIYGAIDKDDTGFQFLDTPHDQKENDVVLRRTREKSESNNERDDDDYDEALIEMANGWLSDFVWDCVFPLESEPISREDFAKKFDWKGFHDVGIEIAKKIAAYLPDNCELWYTTPWEDCSGVIPEAVLIKESK